MQKQKDLTEVMESSDKPKLTQSIELNSVQQIKELLPQVEVLEQSYDVDLTIHLVSQTDYIFH